MGFAQFMSSSAGRAIRAIAGIVLIIVGIIGMPATWGWIVGIVGLLPLAAGVFDICIFGPLLGGKLSGKANRQQPEG